jgi:hypothetical protein
MTNQSDTLLDVEDKEYNLYIVNFIKLFEINIQFNLLQNLKKYNCIDKLKADAKAFFYHHIILEICEYILKHSKGTTHKIIIYNNLEDLTSLEAFFPYEAGLVSKLVQKILQDVKKYLPVRVFDNPYSFHYFINASNGKKMEILLPLRAKSNETFEKYTFNKALKFSKKQNLTFLSDTFFSDLKSKQMMFC